MQLNPSRISALAQRLAPYWDVERIGADPQVVPSTKPPNKIVAFKKPERIDPQNVSLPKPPDKAVACAKPERVDLASCKEDGGVELTDDALADIEDYINDEHSEEGIIVEHGGMHRQFRSIPYAMQSAIRNDVQEYINGEALTVDGKAPTVNGKAPTVNGKAPIVNRKATINGRTVKNTRPLQSIAEESRRAVRECSKPVATRFPIRPSPRSQAVKGISKVSAKPKLRLLQSIMETMEEHEESSKPVALQSRACPTSCVMHPGTIDDAVSHSALSDAQLRISKLGGDDIQRDMDVDHGKLVESQNCLGANSLPQEIVPAHEEAGEVKDCPNVPRVGLIGEKVISRNAQDPSSHSRRTSSHSSSSNEAHTQPGQILNTRLSNNSPLASKLSNGTVDTEYSAVQEVPVVQADTSKTSAAMKSICTNCYEVDHIKGRCRKRSASMPSLPRRSDANASAFRDVKNWLRSVVHAPINPTGALDYSSVVRLSVSASSEEQVAAVKLALKEESTPELLIAGNYLREIIAELGEELRSEEEIASPLSVHDRKEDLPAEADEAGDKRHAELLRPLPSGVRQRRHRRVVTGTDRHCEERPGKTHKTAGQWVKKTKNAVVVFGKIATTIARVFCRSMVRRS